MNQQQFRNITYLSDTSGTGLWRHIFQIDAVNCVSNKLNTCNTFTQYPILDPNYYKGITSITAQRWINDQQRHIFCNLFKPICDANGSWLIYAIDDAMHYEEIPLYNRGRRAFEDPKTQENIKTMLNTADLVVVTTNRIKEYYHTKYGVPLENILAVPNFLPRSWIDDKYDLEKSVEDFRKNKAKPRIGIVSSLSHYNVDNIRKTIDGKAVRKKEKSEIWIDQENHEVNFNDTLPILDDLDEVIDTIISTVNDFQWVLFGYNPPKLKEYIDKKKIEFHPGVALLNYPGMLKRLHLQAIVAPIQNTLFNNCKSPIKFMECAAIGVPLFASNCPPYSDYMPDKSKLFSSSAELKEKLLHLKFQTSIGSYRNQVEANYKWLNSPHTDGDFNIRNYWLEDNLNVWIDLFRLRNKGLSIKLSDFIPQYEEQKKKKSQQTIFKSEDGKVEITK